MTKQHFYLISLFALISIMLTKCDKDKKDDECTETAMPEISRGFSIDIIVQTKDSVPWSGPVTMTFWKEYCNLETSGEYTFNGFCDYDGYFYPNAIPTYTFANTEDCVYVKVQLHESNTYYYCTETREYYYEEVYPLITGVEETYEIYLSWYSAEN